VTVVDENGYDVKPLNGITDNIYSHVQGFPVSTTVYVSQCMCYDLRSRDLIIT
jgi:hypothetical protein